MASKLDDLQRRRDKNLSNLDESVSGQMKRKLFVEFPEHSDIMVVKSHLKKRIRKSRKFSCENLQQSSETSHSSAGLFVKLEFASKNMAKRAANDLRKSNKSEQMIMLRYAFNKHLTKRSFDENTALRRIRSEMGEKALKQLQKHDEKIEATEKKLEALTPQNINLPFNYEQKALEEKLSEMLQQKREFTQTKDKILAKLEDPDLMKNFVDIVDSVRLKLRVEMARLDKAFPIYARRQEIVNVVLNNSVCVVLGETGSGKSTQMPQYLYEAGLGETGVIACTQPRKVTEMKSKIRTLVRCRLGTRKKAPEDTKIIYLADESLLNEMLNDPSLSKYSCVVVGEAHERSVYTDLLLGMIKKCLPVRSELKVVITSAMIGHEVFVRYFKDCPVVKASGRSFPVDVIWPDPKFLTPFQNHLETAVRVTADIHETENEGDILVFLTSPIETDKCCARLEETLRNKDNYKCLKLHGKQRAEEQQVVFEQLPGRKRKIVCATNIAETSVTVPGIKYVVDSGLVKEMRYDPKKGLSSLDTVVISKSSAEQRKGRAGLISSGKCFRLYTEEDYENMETDPLPQITKVQLAQALLKLLYLDVDPFSFEFIQSPSQDSLKLGMKALEDLGASKLGKITKPGMHLVTLPFSPRLGKLVLLGIDEGIGYEALSLAALTEVWSSLFYSSGTVEDKNKSDHLRIRFNHPTGDHLTMLRLYREWFLISKKQKNVWCSRNSIDSQSLCMVQETTNEAVAALRGKREVRVKFLQNFPAAEEKLKHIIFKSSVKSNLAMYLGHPRAGYVTAAQRQQGVIHPSSSVNMLCKEEPEWVVFEQLLNTSRNFFSVISVVDKDAVHESFLNGELEFDPNEMEKMKVTLSVSTELGQVVLEEFVGKGFCNVKSVEEEIMKSVGGNLAFVDADKDRLRVQIHVSESESVPNHGNIVEQVINARLHLIVEKLKNADIEIPLDESYPSVRAVLERGGIVRDLLFATDYRDVYVEDAVNTKVEIIEQQLSRYGIVTACSAVGSRRASGLSRGHIATFRNKTSAQEAVAKEDRISPYLKKGDNIRKWTLKLTWTRRALKGHGYLSLINIDDRDALLSCKCLKIDGELVELSLNKTDETTINMKHLKRTATEEDIKEAVRLQLKRGEKEKVVDKVVLIREDEFETTEEVMESLKEELLSQISPHCPDKKLKLLLPDPRAAYYTAFLCFTNPKDWVKISNAIPRKQKILNKAVSVRLDFSTSIFFSKDHFNVLKTDVKNLESEVNVGNIWVGVQIYNKTTKNGHVYVNISSQNIETLVSIKNELDSMVSGQRVDIACEPNVQIWSRKGCRDRMAVIQQETGTIIRGDVNGLRIIGTQENRQKAVADIEDYLRMLSTCLKKEFRLNRGNQRGLMKRVLEVYGIDLGKFRKLTGVEAAELDIRKHILKVTGTQESLQKASNELKSCVENLLAQAQDSDKKLHCDVDCVVCFWPITEGQLHRLNLCGHAYCLDCAKLQVQTAVDKHDLPLRCVQDGCGELWCLKDLEQLLVAGGRTRHQLLQAAMHSFMVQNKRIYHHCLTADCPVVFPLSTDRIKFICENCQAEICTSCADLYHDGLTCAEYRSGKKDPGLLDWLRKDKESNKLCPECRTPIEKNGGCLHVTCLVCKTHICWVCMRTFTSFQDCYGHLQKKHGKISDEFPI